MSRSLKGKEGKRSGIYRKESLISKEGVERKELMERVEV